MGFVKRFLQSSSPLVKLLMAISITSLLAVGNKMYLAPYLRRRRYNRAEDWANAIIEQEEVMEHTADRQ